MFQNYLMLNKIVNTQYINSNISTVWDFISSPNNLSLITPGYMKFEIINETKLMDKMYSGQIIEYKVSPVLRIPLKWVTEITHVEEGYYFVDEQRVGPYAFWHHKHFIKKVNDVVEMTDIVHYKLPFGFLGRLANSLFIKKQLEEIFKYRHQKIEEHFNA